MDATDFTTRLARTVEGWSQLCTDPMCVTAWDFCAYYSNIVWFDVAMAAIYWANIVHTHVNDMPNCLTSLEKVFAQWLFEPLTRAQFESWSENFPWLEINFSVDLTFVAFFQGVILSHNAFPARGDERGGGLH